MRWSLALPLVVACTPIPEEEGSAGATSSSAASGASEGSGGEASSGGGTTEGTGADTGTDTDAPTTTTGAESSTAATTDDTGESMTGDATTGEEACPLPPSVNAMISAQSVLLPLYPVDDRSYDAVAYRRQGGEVDALGPSGELLWTATIGEGALAGGFDFDADGWPDLAIARHDTTGPPCGEQSKGSSWLSFFHGVDGAHAADTEIQSDICWTFGDITYPTTQWTAGGVLFGADSPAIMLTPTYAATSSLAAWNGDDFSVDPLHYPSVLAYDTTYTQDKLNPWNTGTSFVANSHIGNGLVLGQEGDERAVFWTSGRALQYAFAPLSAGQLLNDSPYISAGRTDMAGRNYGLVARDPGAPERLFLLAGTNASTVYADMIAGQISSDPWGQIERHVSIYSTDDGTVEDVFYSYAHDANDGHQYQGRVVYPDSPFVRRGEGEPSRVAYNVYTEGHWFLHISAPSTLADALVIRGLMLWDIRDLDGDGTDEWVVSPVELPGDPDVPGYYFPRWMTSLYRWDEEATALDLLGTYEAGVPELVAAFRQPDRSTSMSYLYPAPVVALECAPRLVLRDARGQRTLITPP